MAAASDNESKTKTHRLRILPWLAGLFITVAIYVLSVGPVVRFVRPDIIPGTDIMTIYEPLGILCDHSKTAERFFDWYVGLWEEPDPRVKKPLAAQAPPKQP